MGELQASITATAHGVVTLPDEVARLAAEKAEQDEDDGQEED